MGGPCVRRLVVVEFIIVIDLPMFRQAAILVVPIEFSWRKAAA